MFFENPQEVDAVVSPDINNERTAIAQVGALEKRPGVVELGPRSLMLTPQ